MNAIVRPKAKQRKAGNRGETGTESEQECVMIIFAHSHRGHTVSAYFSEKKWDVTPCYSMEISQQQLFSRKKINKFKHMLS